MRESPQEATSSPKHAYHTEHLPATEENMIVGAIVPLAADTETIAEARGILATARDVCHDLGIKWIPNQVAFSEVTMMGDPTKRHSQPWYSDVPQTILQCRETYS